MLRLEGSEKALAAKSKCALYERSASASSNHAGVRKAQSNRNILPKYIDRRKDVNPLP